MDRDFVPNPPVASRIVLLEQVREQEPGCKVRVFGCVHQYHGDSATLILRDQYTSTSQQQPHSGQSQTIVAVSVKQYLDQETIDHELVQVGAWINVLGYVRKRTRIASEIVLSQHGSRERATLPKCQLIEATMIWSAGAILPEDYRSAVRELQGVMSSAP